jgi:hypothetical protein
VRAAQGKLTSHGLPEPDRPMLSAPLAVSDCLPNRLDQGDIVVKPSIERFDGDRVCFADGSAERADAVIYCTGYKISFPFLDETLIGADDAHIPLYRRVIPPGLAGLYFIGLVQPIGAIMPIAEIQSRWVADLLQGQAQLPSRRQMRDEIASYRSAIVRRYGRAPRQAIQVDFLGYQRQIQRELRAGVRRNRGADRNATRRRFAVCALAARGA